MGDFGIQEGLMIRNAITDIQDRNKAAASEKEFGKHLAGMQQNPQGYKPGEDYDPVQFEKAKLAHIGTMMKGQDFREGVFKEQKSQIDAQFSKSMAFYKQGKAAAAMNDRAGELKAYEMTYEQANDGWDLQVEETGYTLVNKLTGKKKSEDFGDPEKLRVALQGMADNLMQDNNYAMGMIKGRMEMAQTNSEQEWTPLQNTDTKEKGHTRRVYNLKTGKLEREYQSSGETIDEDEALKRGLVTPEAAKTMAEADYKHAQSISERKKPGSTSERTRATGTLEKNAELYMRAYTEDDGKAISLKKATDMARQDASRPLVQKGIEVWEADNMPDYGKKKWRDAFKAKREQLMRDYGPTPPAKTKARGLPKDAKTGGGKLTSELAQGFLKEAGGDKAKARKLAKKQGYKF